LRGTPVPAKLANPPIQCIKMATVLSVFVPDPTPPDLESFRAEAFLQSCYRGTSPIRKRPPVVARVSDLTPERS